MQTKKSNFFSIAGFLIFAILLTSLSAYANQSIQAAAPNNSTPVLFPLDTFPTSIEANSSLSYQLAGFDLDGDPLTYSFSPAVAGASLNPATGLFTWTPSTLQTGVQTFNFSLSDGIDTDTLSASITVNASAVVLPPVITQIANQTLTVGQTLNLTINASSPSNLPLTLSAILPTGATFNTDTKVITWKPTAQGVSTIKVTATDGSNSTSMSFTVTVNPAPVTTATTSGIIFNRLSNKTATVGKTLYFTVSAYTVPKTTITYSARLPYGARLDARTGAFSWKPTSYNAGKKYYITFKATNGKVSATKTISISVYRASSSD